MVCMEQKNKNIVTKLTMLIIFAAAVGVLTNRFGEGISGNDFWWHIKMGEWICEHGYIPKTDIFSWYGIQVELHCTPQEWLSEVIFFQIYHYAGEIGIYLFSFCCAFAMLVLLWKQAKQYIEKNVLISGIFFVALPAVLYNFFYGRPQVFGFFLLYFDLKCLYAFWKNQNSRWIYLVPILACCWSNLHGGSSNLSYLLCIVVLIAGMMPWEIGCIHTKRFSVKSRMKLLGVTILSILAILVNPVGTEILTYPYVNMGDDFMLSMISEWRAPDAKSILELVLYFLPIGLMLLGFFAEKEEIQWLDLLMLGFFLLLFLRSVRFIILWDIAACFCAFRYMPLCNVKELKTKGEKGVMVLAGVFLLILSGNGIGKLYQTCKNGEMISRVMSEEMIHEIERDNPQRILNDYNLGEALIFHDIKVFIDSRVDLYERDHILQDAASLMYLVPMVEGETDVDVEQLFEKYQFDGVVMQKDRAFYTYMKSHPERFKLIKEDESVAYFAVVKG